MREHLLVSAFLRGGRVIAGLLSSGERAVILSIAVGGQGIVVVLSRVASLDTILGLLTSWLSHGKRRKQLRLGLYLGLGCGQCCPAGGFGWPDGPEFRSQLMLIFGGARLGTYLLGPLSLRGTLGKSGGSAG